MKYIILLLITTSLLGGVTISKPKLILTDMNGVPIEGVSKSTDDTYGMSKASFLPPGKYLLIRETPAVITVTADAIPEPEPEPVPPEPDPIPEPEPTPEPLPENLTYYISNCLEGSVSYCIPGNNQNDGLTPETAWRTYDQAQDMWNSLQPGESIAFASGGSFLVEGKNKWINSESTVENPVTVTSYQPEWGNGAEPRPVIMSMGQTVFGLDNGGNAKHQEGYVFKNLNIQCLAPATAFFLYNDIDDVTIDNVRVQFCSIGVNAQFSNQCDTADTKCDKLNERLTLTNSQITDNTNQGFLGGGNGYLIDNNTFDNNGDGSNKDHNIYLGSGGGDTFGVTISNNKLTRSSVDDSGKCQGTSLVVHGKHSSLTISGNDISEEIGKAGPGCWGLSVNPGSSSFEAFTDVIIKENIIKNVGNSSLVVAACKNCLIKKNEITQDQLIGGAGVVTLPDSNNQISSDITIIGNIIKSNQSGFSCLSNGLPSTAYAEISNNACNQEP